MFKKLSKILLSTSLAMVACGAGIAGAGMLKGKEGARADSDISVTVDLGRDKVYTLYGNKYGSDEFYTINNVEELSLVSYMVSVAKNKAWADYNFELKGDINLSSKFWTAIGTYDNPYTGIFNGNGYTINGLNSAKTTAESMTFFVKDSSELIVPENGSFYFDGVNYYKFEENKGYILVDQADVDATKLTEVDNKEYSYYGFFGCLKNAEITDIVIGKNSYVYKNDIQNSYSGILAGYAENSKFYNIYDSGAEVNAFIAEESGKFVATTDIEVVVGKEYYQVVDGVVTKVEAPVVESIANYLEKVYKIDAGKYTYYYKASQSSVDLYSSIEYVGDIATLPNTAAFTITLSEGKVGEIVIEDRSYNAEYDSEENRLMLVMKDRYLLSGTVDSVTSIVIDGTTYYVNTTSQPDGYDFSIHADSAFTTDAIYDENKDGFITVDEKVRAYVFSANDANMLKVLQGSEVCSIGYVNNDCSFYKGTYYRLNTTQYIGIGVGEDSALAYAGTINVGGTNYYYKYVDNTQLNLYADISLIYASYTGRGTKDGIGSISVSGTDYVFHYDKKTGDLELSAINNYKTLLPYTVEHVEGEVRVETLDKGQVITFNASTSTVGSAGIYYRKGSDENINTYKMLYVNGLITELTYNDSFVKRVTVLPTNYIDAATGNYYIISQTSAATGYVFLYWAVPRASDGVETIVYADVTNSLHSYVLSTDTAVDASKTYYTFKNSIFTTVATPSGNPVTNKYYEFISQDETIENIIANEYQVNSVWGRNGTVNGTKAYVLYVDGTKLSNIGYGMKWDTVASKVTKAGYDLTGLYYYTEGYGTANAETGDKIFAYSLQYEYDNYGNLSNFSYLKTTDTSVNAEKSYYSYNAETQKFTLVEIESGDPSALGYYEREINTVIYGQPYASGELGYEYFMANWDNGGETQNIYVYATWQKRPVLGKASFTNTIDAYTKTEDTVIEEGKEYYIYEDGEYKSQAFPTIDEIGNYYEKTTKYLVNKFTDVQFSGIANKASTENEDTNYFFKLSEEEQKFRVSFDLATYYTVNYIYPSTTGTLDITAINYYLYDEGLQELTHVHYDAATTSIVRDIVSSDIVVGSWASTTSFVKHNEDGTTVTYLLEDLDTSEIYVDVKTLPGYAEVYTFNGTSLVAQSTLYKNENNFSYTQEPFTENKYKLFVDIMREEIEVGFKVTQAEGLEGKASYTVYQDGMEIDSVSDIDGDSAKLKFKVDSIYEVVVEASTRYSVDAAGTYFQNFTEFTTEVKNGRGYLRGKFETKNPDQVNYPSLFVVNLIREIYTAYADYTFEEYVVEGAEMPAITITSLNEGEPTGVSQTLSHGTGVSGLTNYDGNAKIVVNSNVYYSVDKVELDVYQVSVEDVQLNSADVTIVNQGNIFTTISMDYDKDGTADTYYTLSNGWVSGTNYTGHLYTLSKTEQLEYSEESGEAFVTGIGNKCIIVVRPTLSKVAYGISGEAVGVVDLENKTFDSIYGIDGDISTNSGNAVYVKNVELQDCNTYYYGDKVVLAYDLTSDYYNLTNWYLKNGDVIYLVASKGGSTWSIAESFREGSSATKLGTAQVEAIDGASYLTLTFDQVEPCEIEIYGEFVGKDAIVNFTPSAAGIPSAFVENYDGKGSAKALAYNIDVLQKAPSNTFGEIKYGDVSNKIIAYTHSATSAYKIAGWAVYDSKASGTTEEKITILYEYDEPQAGNNSLEISYYELFVNDEYDHTVLLQKLFAGDSELYLIPVVIQNTISITLNAGAGEGSSVTGLTFYAGGDGLDISAYVNSFTKTGYSAIGWASTDPTYTTLSNTITFDGVANISEKYDNPVTISRIFEANTYKIFLKIGEGETYTSSNGLSVYQGEGELDGVYYYEVKFDSAYNLTEVEKIGYRFVSWMKEGQAFALSGTYNEFAGDIVLTSSLAPNSYKVNLKANKGSLSGSETKTVDVVYDTELLDTITEVPTRDGYTFDGWYIVKGENDSTGILVTDSTTLSVALGASYVNLGDEEKVMTLVASWKRVDGYYTSTKADSQYTVDYNSTLQTFTAITDVLAGGTSIADFVSATKTITTTNGDNVTFTWAYKAASNGTYQVVEKGDLNSIALKNVAESGFYKLTIIFTDTAELVSAEMTNGKDATIEVEIEVAINPLNVQINNLAVNYEAVFNGTSSPVISGFDLTQAEVNVESINVNKYAIGTLGSSFTAGVDVGTYNAFRFQISFVSNYEYVAGNYANIVYEDGIYYVYQASTIEIKPLEVSLNPVIPQVAYTGESQTISFAKTINIAGTNVVIEAFGTLKEGYFGNNTNDTTVNGNEAFTISGTTISTGVLANYTVSLGGSVVIKAGSKAYTFAPHVITKENSASAISAPVTLNDYNLIFASISAKLSGDTTATDFDLNEVKGSYKLVEMNGVTYVFSNENNLILQLNNDASTLNVYTLHDLTKITLATENAEVTVEENDTYYLFGAYSVGQDDDEKEVASEVIKAFTEKTFDLGVNGENTYYIGYTDLVKLVMKAVSDDANATEEVLVKLGSAYTYAPTRTGYEFDGWSTENSDILISGGDTITVSASAAEINSKEVTATWKMKGPEIADANSVTKSANEGNVSITLEDVFGSSDLSAIIENYNPTINYMFTWYKGTGSEKTPLTEIENGAIIKADTDSTGAYTIVVSVDDNTLATEVTFNITIETVVITIDKTENGTYTNKKDSFVDSEKLYLNNDGQFVYTYSYNNVYDANIFIVVPESTATSKEYKLSDNVTNGNVYFQINRIKDANGEAVNESNVNIGNAGTYRVTLLFNNKIYSVSETQYFDIVVNKYTYEFTNTILKEKLSIASDKQVFEKTYGEDDSKLILKTTDLNISELPEEFNISFSAGNVEEIGVHDIISAASGNDNYTFTISSTDTPKLQIIGNEAGKLYINLSEIKYYNSEGVVADEYTYDGKEIVSVELSFDSANSTAEAPIWKFIAKDEDGKTRVEWKAELFEQSDDGLSVDKKGESFATSYYTFNVTAFKNVGTYGTNKINVEVIEGAPLGEAEITFANSIEICAKKITINGVSKVCDMTNGFDSSVHTIDMTGVVAGDEVIVKGSFASIAAGTGINVSALVLSGSSASNYTLVSTTTTGEIKASEENVTITLNQSEFTYGTIKEGLNLKDIFEITVKNASDKQISTDFFTIDSYEIVSADYSTGRYLKEGSYTVKIKITSSSFTNLNGDFEKNITITKKDVELEIEGGVVTKVYDNTTNVNQNITANILSGDQTFTIVATYNDVNVGDGKIIRIIINSNDLGNYNVTNQNTITGSITARDKVTLYIQTELSGGFADGQHATMTNAISDGNNFYIDIANYTNTTTGATIMALITGEGNVPEKVGYTFVGWYKDSVLSTIVDENNINSIINEALKDGSNATVYAKWTINSYSVDIVSGKDENTTIEIAKTTFNYCDEVSFEVLAGDGYEISSVVVTTKNNSQPVICLNNTFKMPSQDVVITTSTGYKTYTITYEPNGGTFKGGINGVEDTYTFGTEKVLYTEAQISKEGYTLSGWYEASAPENILTTLSATTFGDKTLYAMWTAKTYKIYLDIGSDGSFSDVEIDAFDIGTEDGKYYINIEYGAEIILPTPILSGYEFKYWMADGYKYDYEGQLYNNVTNITLSAYFEASIFDLTFNCENIKTIKVYNVKGTEVVLNAGTNSYKVQKDERYRIELTPSDGYSIDDQEWTKVEGKAYYEKLYTFDGAVEIAVSATANENNLTICIDEAQKDFVEFTVKVKGVEQTLSYDDSIDGYKFTAHTDDEVIVEYDVKAGYTLGSPVYSEKDIKVNAVEGGYKLSGFVKAETVTFSVTANSNTVTIVRDENDAITDLTHDSNKIVLSKDIESQEFTKWTGSENTGNSIEFKPVITSGYKLTKVLYTYIAGNGGNEELEIAVGETKTNDGVTIIVAADYTVTISGFTSSVNLKLVTDMKEYTFKIEALALKLDGTIDSNVSIYTEINGEETSTAQIKYLSEVEMYAETSTAGYKFIGWFTTVSETEGVYSFDLTHRETANNPHSIDDMLAANTTYYAVFQITTIEVSLTVITDDIIDNNYVGGRLEKQVDEDRVSITTKDYPLYNSVVKYYAVASKGYEFDGWYLEDGTKLGQDQDGYTVVDITKDSKDRVVESSIEFAVVDSLNIIAKFKAKELSFNVNPVLVVNGVVVGSMDVSDYTLAWGTYDGTTFTQLSDSLTVNTFTGRQVAIKVVAGEGYYVGDIYSEGTAVPYMDMVNKEAKTTQNIFLITNLNADEGEYKLSVRFYSDETTINMNFKKGATAVEAGRSTALADTGLVIQSNNSSNVKVKAVTNSSIVVTAYVRLGFDFVVDGTGKVQYAINGDYQGVVIATQLNYEKLSDYSQGFTARADFEISGYEGGFFDFSLMVKSKDYIVELYDESFETNPKFEVSGGDFVITTPGVKSSVQDIPEKEGYTLKGFYTYEDGSGIMYVDGNGNGVSVFNENGYYWNGSEYVPAPYFDVTTQTFNLKAVYSINKTTVVVNIEPANKLSEDVTIGNIIPELNPANSWTTDEDKFYAEILYGAKVSVNAPSLADHVFAYWKVERVNAAGVAFVSYIKNPIIADLDQNSYSAITLTAVYYIRQRVSSMAGGMAVVSGINYEHVDGEIVAEQKSSITEFYFSTRDEITFSANTYNGYDFIGWYNVETEEIMAGWGEVHTISGNEIKSYNLVAQYEGREVTVNINAPISENGRLVSVYLDGEEVTTKESFRAKVGQIVEIHMDIPANYQAIWTGGRVNNELSSNLRIYSYIVDIADEDINNRGVITLTAEYQSRQFKVNFNIKVDNQAVENELGLAGEVIYDGQKLQSAFSNYIIYGSVISFNVSTGLNYIVDSIRVNGIELNIFLKAYGYEIVDYVNGGVINLQSNAFNYELGETAVTVDISYKRILWLDGMTANYTLSGKGTTEDPYIIASTSDLAFMAYMINVVKDKTYASASYELRKDLDLTGKYWNPIGTEENPFSGRFNFGVYEISGISVIIGHKGTNSHDGLFGVTTSTAYIYHTESKVGLIIAIIASGIAVIGIAVGIFLGIRAKKKREIDKLANG